MENNGRVNLFGPPSAGGGNYGNGNMAESATISGFEYKQTSETDFQGDMLRGNWESNAVSKTFFSRSNIETVQKNIKKEVFTRSAAKGYQIDDQSVDELKIIMRAMFYQYCKNLSTNIQGQVDELNERVVQWSVPHILSAVDHYFYYLNDIDKMPVPLSHPVHLSRAGTKSLPTNPFM
jgi:hypothetical protein